MEDSLLRASVVIDAAPGCLRSVTFPLAPGGFNECQVEFRSFSWRLVHLDVPYGRAALRRAVGGRLHTDAASKPLGILESGDTTNRFQRGCQQFRRLLISDIRTLAVLEGLHKLPQRLDCH